jgi:cytochrome c-type biogenesis protein CcmH/NrfG
MKKSELNIEKMLKEHQQNFSDKNRDDQLRRLEDALRENPNDKGLVALIRSAKFLKKSL